MNEPRPARPPLATISCIYLIVTAFIPLPIILILLWSWSNPFFHFPLVRLLPRTSMPVVICSLAIAGAITLWQMRRAAFFLLAIRLILSIVLQVIHLPRNIAFFHRMSRISRPVADSALRMAFASIAAKWLLSALIVWYVFRITTPQRASVQSPDPGLLA